MRCGLAIHAQNLLWIESSMHTKVWGAVALTLSLSKSLGITRDNCYPGQT